MAEYVTRFAPSPTGPLHLGHAFSALTAWDRAQDRGGQFLLRIEDIDRARCRTAWETAIYDDLHWLGLRWPNPVVRQSDRLETYRAVLERLSGLGVTYPCRCSRSDILAALSAPQEGATRQDSPVYPGTCRGRSMADADPGDAIRLNMAKAMDLLGVVSFNETGPLHRGVHIVQPDVMCASIGDVVLARRDLGTSYHLSVVVDDAAQAITEVVRGEDLFEATFIHVTLQALLQHKTPSYHHHELIRDSDGKRLAKRDDARAISHYRSLGASAQDIRHMIGL